jgi:hypothetical protein
MNKLYRDKLLGKKANSDIMRYYEQPSRGPHNAAKHVVLEDEALRRENDGVWRRSEAERNLEINNLPRAKEFRLLDILGPPPPGAIKSNMLIRGKRMEYEGADPTDAWIIERRENGLFTPAFDTIVDILKIDTTKCPLRTKASKTNVRGKYRLIEGDATSRFTPVFDPARATRGVAGNMFRRLGMICK